MGFKFRTREEYKRVKKMDRQQLEDYINDQKQLSIAARGLITEAEARKERKKGWDLCSAEYSRIISEQVDEILDSIDEGIREAVLMTKGIGVKRGQELLNNLDEARQKIQQRVQEQTEQNKPQWEEEDETQTRTEQ